MLIDWFTVGAQLLNFLVLVWLLRRFLYQPIRRAIDARAGRMDAERADLAAKKVDAQRVRDDFEKKSTLFEGQRSAMLAAAVAQAATERARQLENTRQAAESLRIELAGSLDNELTRLSTGVTALVRTEVFAIARQVLADLATVTLEERIGEVFTRRLREMEPNAKRVMGSALSASAEPALVRSAFEISPEQKAAIQNALNETFSAAVRVRFENSKQTVCGIEIGVGGQKLAWSIDDYLVRLQEKLALIVSSATHEVEGQEIDGQKKPVVAAGKVAAVPIVRATAA